MWAYGNFWKRHIFSFLGIYYCHIYPSQKMNRCVFEISLVLNVSRIQFELTEPAGLEVSL
jgi:hypothetical protein